MKKLFLALMTIVISVALLPACKKEKCADNANATIIGYDQTKGLCGTGYIMKIYATKDAPEKQFIVREITGDYASQINIDSKFPLKVRYVGKLTPIENCPNVLSTLEVFKPVTTCSD